MKRRIVSLALVILLLSGLAPVGALYVGSAAAVEATTAPLRHGYEATEEDAAGTLSFENLEPRMRAGNPTLRSAQSTLDAHLAFDRKMEYDRLFKLINDSVDGAIALSGGNLSLAASMTAGVSAMREQLDMLSEENWAETIEALDRQINHIISQLIMGAESLYFNILNYENTLADLTRTIASLERGLAEMQLRHRLGQISALTLSQYEASLAAAKSQEESLRLAVSNMKAALENLLGEPVTGTLTLLALPPVSDAARQLADLDFDQALRKAEAQSFTLFEAKKTLEDAEDTWKDAKRANPPGGSRYKTAEQTYLAAVYTYEAAVKNFTLSLRNLHSAIADQENALRAAESDLAFQEKNYEAQALRHKLGQISDTALHNAQNERLAAQSALENAKAALFSAYQSYSWAVHHGVTP